MESILETRGVKKSFISTDRSVDVLDGVDLKLNRGESLSIQGPSGCGKSTYLNILGSLEQPDSGEVIWGGTEITQFSNRKLAQMRNGFIGFIYQHYYLIPELTVLDNVPISCKIRGSISIDDKSRAEKLLERVGLSDRMSQSSVTLSGGERQRVALARALVNQAPLILADEPTGNLDENTGEAVMELLLQFVRKKMHRWFLLLTIVNLRSRRIEKLY